MTFTQEFASWFSPLKSTTNASPPSISNQAPSLPKLALSPGKRTVVTFLRHCGCPFAEKTFVQMREAAKTHSDIDFIAVSHSNQEATEKWHKSLPNYGSEPNNLRIVVDSEREIYGAYGLGATGFLHVLDPRAMKQAFSMGSEGYNVRPTESGSRWQQAGTFAIGGDGKVKFGGPAARADDLPDMEEFVKKTSS